MYLLAVKLTYPLGILALCVVHGVLRWVLLGVLAAVYVLEAQKKIRCYVPVMLAKNRLRGRSRRLLHRRQLVDRAG